METDLAFRFTPAARDAMPAGVQLDMLTDAFGEIPTIGDDVVFAGSTETKVFRIIGRQLQYLPGTTAITFILDVSPEAYIQSW
jgi:hypothetical protein